MQTIALVVTVLGCLFIVAIGLRFLLRPRSATLGFGIAEDDVRGLTAIKGVRDITSGVVPLVAWAAGGTTVLGWVLLAAALTPIGDAIIVLARGGRPATALGIHGVTAVLLVAAGIVLLAG